MFSVNNGTVEAIHAVNPNEGNDTDSFKERSTNDMSKNKYDISMGSKVEGNINSRALPSSVMTYECLNNLLNK